MPTTRITAPKRCRACGPRSRRCTSRRAAIPAPGCDALTASVEDLRALEKRRMKRLFAVALGILTAIGGFVDIGDLVTNAVVGAEFGIGTRVGGHHRRRGHLPVRRHGRTRRSGQRPHDVRDHPRATRTAGRAREPRRIVPHQPAHPDGRDRRHRARAAARGRGRVRDSGSRSRCSRVWIVIWRTKFSIDGERRRDCSASR